MGFYSSFGTSTTLNEKQELAFKLRNAMKDDWKGVVELYERNHIAHETIISKTGYTALHIAVADGKEDVVANLVKFIKKSNKTRDRFDPLKIKNQRGNTPLHIAASMGNVKMCKHIIGDVKEDCDSARLLRIRNKEGESPIFLAALHGKKETFFYLSSSLNPATTSESMGTFRRNDGNTLLHCAIDGEYMDLAFHILDQISKELATSINVDDKSPLHILASKPSAFKSGSKLGMCKSIIYKFTYVAPLHKHSSKNPQEENDQVENKYPQNYTTLFSCFRTLWDLAVKVTTHADPENPSAGGKSTRNEDENHYSFPKNYITFFEFVKVLLRAVLVFTGVGYDGIINIVKLKEKHIWSLRVLDALLTSDDKLYSYYVGGADPYAELPNQEMEDEIENWKEESQRLMGNEGTRGKKDTAILIASGNGITEMVERIIEIFPMAIYDETEDKKNIVLVALKNRQAGVYKLLLKRHLQNDSLFSKLDEDRNGALHISAMWDEKRSKRWAIPGDALQLLWEIKWYKFVEQSMPENYFVRYNENQKTPEDIFSEHHNSLVTTGSKWMIKTAESCSVVSTLIATVAFASSTALPGGTNEDSGKPIFGKELPFKVFAVASLAALSFSVTSLVMFLAILTSRLTEKDFGKSLPWKLLIGLSSLFVSVASMLVSFCAGHFFVLKESLTVAAFPVYSLTCIPVSFFVAAQFPLYFDLIRATFGSPFGSSRNIRK